MRVLDTFAGIGGFTVAAHAAGMTTAAFVEREPFCQAVLAKNFPSIRTFPDIKQFQGNEVENIDIITGGFPCPPFSIAGKRKGENDERYLWPELARVIAAVKPAWVLGENVGGLTTLGLDKILADLHAIGYDAMPVWAPAAAAGAPHKRERVFIVALSDVAYGDGARRQRLYDDWRQDAKWKDFVGYVGRRLTSLAPRWPAGPGESQFPWEKVRLARAEPGVGGAAHGVFAGVDRSFRTGRKPRLRALGNACVPYQVLPILMAIKTLHDHYNGEVK